jgi:pimeloyl-ACP methyl ester carboxylesterase
MKISLCKLNLWVGLILLAGLGLISLTNLTPVSQASPLLVTPTPTPAPENPPGDEPPLADQVQQLKEVVAELQAEIQNLKSELENLKSKIGNTSFTNPTIKILEELGGQPCPESDFTCVTLTVPVDHFDPANQETLEVVFGVLPAQGQPKGLLVTATGGPGSSGLASADAYVGSFDSAITEQFDIVFFDQRGIGQSGGLQCPIAAAAYYETETDPATPAGEAATVAAAQTFSAACLAEMGSPDNVLPYLSTRQAVEDLELFRQAMGNPQLWLYGESYGTQFAQTYAAAHPENLAGLLLDGTVDLTLSGPDYLREQAQAFNDVLVMTLTACNEDEECAADMGDDAVKVYDQLAAQLSTQPLTYTFPLPSGGSAERQFSLADLEVATANYLYSEASRLLLQRALAAAAQEDLVPLARLLYDSLSLNPENLAPIVDPTFSDAMYYGVECLDYDYDDGAPAESAEKYIRAGDAVDQTIPRLSSIFYGDLPCTFWPGDAGPRPEPLTAPGIPTLVLGATADPATPVSNGERVFSRLADGYLITTQGGAHVIYGRGNACPDDLVTDFLVEDALPEQRETECEGEVASPYVPLPPADARDFESPLEALLSADTEINHLPEYYYWDVVTPTTVGCPYGGTLKFEPGDNGDKFTLKECAFSDGFSLSGSALYSYDLGDFTMDVAVTGLEGQTGQLSYERNENGAIHITGEYGGETVESEQ